jgi:hypothetical protein
MSHLPAPVTQVMGKDPLTKGGRRGLIPFQKGNWGRGNLFLEGNWLLRNKKKDPT